MKISFFSLIIMFTTVCLAGTDESYEIPVYQDTNDGWYLNQRAHIGEFGAMPRNRIIIDDVFVNSITATTEGLYVDPRHEKLTYANLLIEAELSTPAGVEPNQLFVHVKGKGTSNTSRAVIRGLRVPLLNLILFPKEVELTPTISVKRFANSSDRQLVNKDSSTQLLRVRFFVPVVNGLNKTSNAPYSQRLIVEVAPRPSGVFNRVVSRRRAARIIETTIDQTKATVEVSYLGFECKDIFVESP